MSPASKKHFPSLFSFLLLTIGLICGTAHAQPQGHTADDTAATLANASLKEHEPFIRRCYQLAIDAGKKGNHPFGALLVHKGKIVLEAENTVLTDNDFTNHAEMNLMAEAARTLSRQIIPEATVYTSCAPCAMCTATLAMAGFTRIVYGVSHDALNKRFGLKGKSVSCPALFKTMGMELEFVGPVLEKEGLRVFDFWPEKDPHAQMLKKQARK